MFVCRVNNLRVHKVKGISAAIEKSGAKVKFLPLHSPDLSPIELAWSKIKGLLRQAAAQRAIMHYRKSSLMRFSASLKATFADGLNIVTIVFD